MFIDVGARRSWDGAMDRLAGAASKILPSCNLLHKAENFMIFLIAKTIVVNKNKNCSRPNIGLHIVTVTNFLCQTKR